MQVLLKVINGSRSGQKLVLRGGQLVEVGRSPVADFCFGDDLQMSGSHFKLQVGHEVTLEDLSSTNGTFVDKRRVERVRLQGGEVVLAGSTRFSIEIESPLNGSPASSVARSDFAATAERKPLLDGAAPTRDEAGRDTQPNSGPSAPDMAALSAACAQPPPPFSIRTSQLAGTAADVTSLILRVQSGSLEGTKCWLHPGQSLTVGRTELSEFAIPFDSQMSGTHFRIECLYNTCHVRDLDSTNGLFINGRRLAESQLFAGDEILAGDTTFLVQIEGAAGEAKRPETPAGTPSATSAAAAPLPATVRCNAETCSTGLTQIEGNGEDATPVQVARMLANHYHLYVLVDFQRQSALPPEGVTAEDLLFDDMRHSHVSCFVLSDTERTPLLPVIEDMWDQDSLVCVFSELDKAEFREHLRSTAQHSSRQSMFDVCWPGILRSMLSAGNRKSVERHYENIAGVLLESDTPGDWMIYADQPFSDKLEELGFASLDEQPVAA